MEQADGRFVCPADQGPRGGDLDGDRLSADQRTHGQQGRPCQGMGAPACSRQDQPQPKGTDCINLATSWHKCGTHYFPMYTLCMAVLVSRPVVIALGHSIKLRRSGARTNKLRPSCSSRSTRVFPVPSRRLLNTMAALPPPAFLEESVDYSVEKCACWLCGRAWCRLRR